VLIPDRLPTAAGCFVDQAVVNGCGAVDKFGSGGGMDNPTRIIATETRCQHHKRSAQAQFVCVAHGSVRSLSDDWAGIHPHSNDLFHFRQISGNVVRKRERRCIRHRFV
jgi:hypothetical protein